MTLIKVHLVQTLDPWRRINSIAAQAGLQPYTPEQAQSFLINPAYATFVLSAPMLNRDPVGFLVAQITPPEAEIIDMAILPCFHGMGFGGRILERVLEEMRLCEVEECYLEVRESNRKAIRFYLNHGFTQHHIRPDYYTHPQEDALLFRKSLKADTPSVFLS